MKIIKLFNTTKQNIRDKKHNIFIPICIGNKFFVRKTKINEKKIKSYIKWGLENTKKKILILIVDKIQDTNYSVRSKVTLAGARKRVLKDGQKIQENLKKFVKKNFQNENRKIKVISFQEYENNDPFYEETTLNVYKEFENNLEFKNTVLYAVKSSIKDRTFTEKQYLQLCNYVLDEFSLAYHGVIHNGTHYNMYPYPITDTVLYFIFDIIYQKRFRKFSKKLTSGKVVTVILNSEITTSNDSSNANQKNSEIIDFYNKAANIYDEVVKQDCANIMPKNLVAFYQKNNISNGSILDLGCGTGSIVKELEYYGFCHFTFTGIDFSKKMIQYAQEYYKNIYIGDVLEIIYQFPDDSFDHIIGLSSLYFLDPEKFQQLLKEIKRVCKKSIFISCEQFESSYIPTTRLRVYNHNPQNFDKSKLIKMWNTSQGKIPIYGYFYTKIL